MHESQNSKHRDGKLLTPLLESTLLHEDVVDVFLTPTDRSYNKVEEHESKETLNNYGPALL